MFGVRMKRMTGIMIMLIVIGSTAMVVGDGMSEPVGPVICELEFTLICVSPSVLSDDRDSTVMLLPKKTFFFGGNEYRVMEAFSADSTIYEFEKDTEFKRKVRLTAEFVKDKGIIALVRIHEIGFF